MFFAEIKIMKTRFLPLFIFIQFILLLAGCSPVKYIETETLEPAEIAIPHKINSAVLILNKPSSSFKRIDTEDFKGYLLEEIKYGIADVLNNSPRINSNDIVVPEYEEVKHLIKKDTLTWLDMKAITDTFNVDALIYMDRFALKSSLKDEMVVDHGNLLYKLTFTIVSNTHWRIHYPYQNLQIDDHSYSEKFVWEAYDYSKDEAIARLPEYEKTYREAAYWTGYDYGKRIFPTWKRTARSYYVSGTEEFRKASAKVDSSKYEEAIELWKKNLNHTDAELVSRAAYNIAFAFEMLGKIDMALKWARKSNEIKAKRRTIQYINKLEERRKSTSRLRHQIN